MTGFLLSSSVLTPILGKLGDAHGMKRVLVWALVIFALASLGAALAPSLPVLIGFRVLQGVGAAVFPLSFGIIRDELPPEKVALGIGTVSSAFGVGGGVGLVLSGAILEHLGWQWLFVLGSLPALVAAALIHRWVPDSPRRAAGRADWRGAALLSLALVTLLVALSEAAEWGWGSMRVLGLAGVVGVAVRRLGAHGAPRRRSADRPRDADPPRDGGHERRDVHARLRDDGRVRADAVVPRARRLRLRRSADAGRPAAAPAVARDGGDRPGGRLARRAPRPGAAAARRLALAAVALALLAGAHEHAWMVCAWLGAARRRDGDALAGAGTLVLKHSTPRRPASRAA